ncbi:Malate/L-lactate dehydrogenase [Pseudopedobacter saltans DSM 12145]|uniref:Malate/L-lactate dehydrogenase n=1 Tax=Pseudopedobacter saltans (strain ATCC 51119 / DSM 12145 / JCM 21818 / CCUG 39354 / LMG 10337 / NBRC 100064 / NCIMB 13643) TaxID=762903 RepID=F0S6X7_PSESL|nr:3-dehydro-L-gulonate 2-dehydrogenase [Pseudopedobacter saltans]ADY53240.1 Malate/L-lactate dehydrogenase [Pseudopedobacter saltans DSM 12145]
MTKVSYPELYKQFERVLLSLAFDPIKAKSIAEIFANNSLDGVYSHGLNRFPVFVDYVKKGWIAKDAEPTLVKSLGVIEQWDGQLGPGMLNAKISIQRAIELAKKNGMGCVALKRTNHWMRGGSYGWQAAEAGCIGINFTNTIAIMPPWGAKEPAIGNNPLIIAVPRKEGHIVLDMAMSQYSYGKMQEAELKHKELGFYSGYDEEGNLSKDPTAIRMTKRTLPVGMWKGSGLAMMLDLLASILSDGQTTGEVTTSKSETNISQVFICIDPSLNSNYEDIANKIIDYTKGVQPIEGEAIYYPGEKTLQTRWQNEKEGIPVDEVMWQKLMDL